MKMRKLWAGLFYFFFVGIASGVAQTWNLESGMTFNKVPDYDGMKSFYLSVGRDYLDKGWFNLSSNIGVMRHGGKENVYTSDMNGNLIQPDMKFSGTYLSLNTLFEVKKMSVDGYTFYLGAGPRLDIRLGSGFDSSDSSAAELYEASFPFNPVVFGMRCELGVKKRFGQATEIGLVGAYLPTFTHLQKNGYSSGENAFSVGITIGYLFGTGKRSDGTHVRRYTKRAW